MRILNIASTLFIIILFLYSLSSCRMTGDIITLQNDTLAGKLRFEEDGEIGGSIKYIRIKRSSDTKYQKIKADSILWVRRFMTHEDTATYVPLNSSIHTRVPVYEVHLWDVLGIKKGVAVCSIHWNISDFGQIGNSYEVILINREHRPYMDIVSFEDNLATKQKVNAKMLQFINNRYSKDFTASHFKDQKSMVDYILDRETEYGVD